MPEAFDAFAFCAWSVADREDFSFIRSNLEEENEKSQFFLFPGDRNVLDGITNPVRLKAIIFVH